MPDPNPNKSGQPGEGQEGTGQTGERLLAGRFKSVEELERGYKESGREAQRIVGESKLKDARIAELEAQMELAQMQGQQRQDREPEPDFLPIEDDGIRLSALDKRIQQSVERSVLQTLQPLQKSMEARARMEQSYEDYGKTEPEIRQWLSDNPEMRQIHDEIAQTSPRGALEFAYSKYRDAKIREAAEENKTLAEILDQGKTAAGVRTQQIRRDEPEFSQERYNQLLARAQETGNWDDFLDYRLKGSLKDWQFQDWS